MACTPTLCGQVKTEYLLDLDPNGPNFKVYELNRDTGAKIEPPLDIVRAGLVDEAKRKLQEAVGDQVGTVPDPQYPPCASGCECGGIIWTARPGENGTVTVRYRTGQTPLLATTTGVRTISDGVGRCAAPLNVEKSFAALDVPLGRVTIALNRRELLSDAEIDKIRLALA